MSSQVQCLNALAPLVDQPERLALWLGQFLPVAEVLPFGAKTGSPYDATDHVVFEWQGLVDHLGEWRGQAPTRGSRATSIDAAVRYHTPAGTTELALIEWKYTESYPYGGRLSGSAYDQHRRIVRYRALVESSDGPVHLVDGLDYEDLLAEPTYPLLRQQLLAWRLEEAGELGIDRAVVVHAAPRANTALLQASLGDHRFARHAGLLGGLIPGWQALLRRPDRFVSVDTAALFAAPGICGDDFRARYHHLTGVPIPASPTGDGVVQPPTDSEPLPLDDVLPPTMPGEDLEELAFDGDTDGVWVGRRGGLTGAEVGSDIATGQ